MKILGLCGHAGSGKDHLASKLKLGGFYGFVERVALADELRLELEEELGLGHRHRNNPLWNKPYSESVRWILQHYGSEFRRAQDPEYWVRKTQNHILDIEQEGVIDLVVMTDVRFANEAEMIRDLDGRIVEVWADIEVRRERLGGLPPSHQSEVIDFETDYRVESNGMPELPALLREYLLA